jgi:type I restriction enzyme, R subunit
MTPLSPEEEARRKIDEALAAAGWTVQDRSSMNVSAGPGVAVREFKLTTGHGYADYMLFAGGKAVGVLEAKPRFFRVPGVEQDVRRASGHCRAVQPDA